MSSRQLGFVLTKERFFQIHHSQGEALTYNDVSAIPRQSDVVPRNASVAGWFTRNVPLRTSIVSAAMDTVTESRLAIALAWEGGIGVIHRNNEPDRQAKHVADTKGYRHGYNESPVTVAPTATMAEISARRKREKHRFHSFPVVSEHGILLGLLTEAHFNQGRPSARASEIMIPIGELIVGEPGITREEAYRLMVNTHLPRLLVVDKDGRLSGMYLLKDIANLVLGIDEGQNMDDSGRLRVAAAITSSEDELERARLLADAGVDVLVLDTAHGNTGSNIAAIKRIKAAFPGIDLMVGNVSQPEDAEALLELPIDGLKVGQGPGAICTTRRVAGIGVPQLSAVYECALLARVKGVPLCADGGLQFSGDFVKAYIAGASSTMAGSLFAGTAESPGEVIPTPQGWFKDYRGMGSLSALLQSPGARARYNETGEADHVTPEGVESRVPYSGTVADVVAKLVGGIRKGFGYIGANNIEEAWDKGLFVRVTPSGHIEGGTHDVVVVTSQGGGR